MTRCTRVGRGAHLISTLLFALAPSAAAAVQAAPADHAAHRQFVLDTFTFEDGTTLPRTIVSYGTDGRLNARVHLEPIPSLWGHVAGGGGDEGAKPWINARIAAFLRARLAD